MVSKKRHSNRRSKKGGYPAANPSSYSSATTYGMAVNGTGNSQYNRVFSNSSPDAQYPSNQSVGVQGQNLGYKDSVLTNLNQKAGSRRKKRGGFWGQIINQALVPFGILGMQQTYKKRKYVGGKSRKNRHKI
jgi:hypothetical protein